MWQRYTLDDVRIICHYLGVVVLFGGVAMCAPLVIAVVFQEWDAAERYLFAAGVSFTLGALMRMLHVMPGQMSRQQAIAVTGFAWIVLALVGAIPLFMSPHYATFSDALFDTVSAFTTTDVSIVVDMDHLSHADNMWRFVMNFCGGLGLIVVGLSLGIFGRMANSNLYSSEGRSEHVLPNVVQTARFIFKFTLSFIVIVGALLGAVLIVHGMEPPRALLHGTWLAMSGFMTAGATPMSTSVAYYHSIALETILMVVMIFGSINFALQSEIWAGRSTSFFRDTEVRTGVIWWFSLLVVFAIAMSQSPLMHGLPTIMRTGMFHLVSAATTTGFVTLQSGAVKAVFPPSAVLVLILLMSVGGSAGSTSGGIKIQRLAIIAKSAFETVKNTASAGSARIVTNYYHVARRRLDASEVREAMTVFIMFITMYAVGTLAGIACGYEAADALAESVAMASNSGITAGISSANMVPFLKFVYILEMWMGRLEYATLIALSVKMFVSLKPRPRKGR